MNVSDLYLFLKESVSDPEGGREGRRERRRMGGGKERDRQFPERTSRFPVHERTVHGI